MIEERLKTVLVADTSLMTLLTGGAYTFIELGNRGFVPKNPTCAAAWETISGLPRLKPSIVIRDRTEAADGERYDSYTKEGSTQGVVEFWMYHQTTHTSLNLIADRVWKAVNGKIFSDVGLVFNIQMLKGLYAPEFDNVALRRDDYSYKRIKRIT